MGLSRDSYSPNKPAAGEKQVVNVAYLLAEAILRERLRAVGDYGGKLSIDPTSFPFGEPPGELRFVYTPDEPGAGWTFRGAMFDLLMSAMDEIKALTLGTFSVHDLKCWPAIFDAIAFYDKRAELRPNDRNYQVGDVLVLNKFQPSLVVNDPVGGFYTGDYIVARVSHVQRLSELPAPLLSILGLNPGPGALSNLAMLSIMVIHTHTPAVKSDFHWPLGMETAGND